MTIIRTALKSDLPGIASVLVETWQRSLKGIVGDDYLPSLEVEHQQRRQAKMIGHPDFGCWVAKGHGQIAGRPSGPRFARPPVFDVSL